MHFVLADTGVTDLTHLNKNITGLYIAHDEISDFSPIANIKNLYQISATGTGLTDPTIFNGLSSLEYIYIPENAITDLRGVDQPLPHTYIVTDQYLQLTPAVQGGADAHLALFNPDGSVPDITWVTPGSYDPATETVHWDEPGINVLEWNNTSNPLFQFSGTVTQFIVKS